MVETLEVTLVIEESSEVVVGVVEDEADGAMIAVIAVIEAERETGITEHLEMTEPPPLFAMTEVVIEIVGIAMTALEVAEHLLLKAGLVHPIMALERTEMDQQS